MTERGNVLEMIFVELKGELEQLEASTHYYSDLPPTPANYQDQWRTTSRFTTEIRFCVDRIVEELARRGQMHAARLGD